MTTPDEARADIGGNPCADRITYDDGFGPEHDRPVLDEVVLSRVKNFHLERMDNGHIWIGVDTEDRGLVHINLWQRGKFIYGRAEENI